MKSNNIFLGIIFMIASVFTLGINDIIVKGLSFKFPVWEIVFFRALSGVFVSIFLVIVFGFASIKTKKPVGHLIRAFSAVACVVLFFFGIKLLLLAENQALFHSAPIIASILAVPILGEKIGFHRIIAVLIGFLGVLIILKPGTELFNLYSLVSLGSGFFAALTYLSTRYLMSTETSISIIFYYSFALLFISIFFISNNFLIPSFLELIPLILLGIVGSFGHYFASLAAKNAEVVIITPFEYSSFIFVTLLGYIFYNEIPDVTIYIGILLIFISGVYIVYREHTKI